MRRQRQQLTLDVARAGDPLRFALRIRRAHLRRAPQARRADLAAGEHARPDDGPLPRAAAAASRASQATGGLRSAADRQRRDDGAQLPIRAGPARRDSRQARPTPAMSVASSTRLVADCRCPVAAGPSRRRGPAGAGGGRPPAEGRAGPCPAQPLEHRQRFVGRRAAVDGRLQQPARLVDRRRAETPRRPCAAVPRTRADARRARCARAFDVRPRPRMIAIEEERARPDVDRLLVLATRSNDPDRREAAARFSRRDRSDAAIALVRLRIVDADISDKTGGIITRIAKGQLQIAAWGQIRGNPLILLHGLQ